MIEVYTLDNHEKEHLTNEFMKVTFKPYSNYMDFKSEILNVVLAVKDTNLYNFLLYIKESRKVDKGKAFLIKNCPIDENVPIFNHKNPLEDKYNVKKSFIGEGFLEFFSLVTDNPLLAYDTRNFGDFFHDVYAQEQYTKTQTQKSDGELFYHNDRTAHPIRADYLNLLCMRSSSKNNIVTSYVDGVDVLKNITDDHKEVLKQNFYITPYDEYSRSSNKSQLVSFPHSILNEYPSLRYYETRTKPLDDAPLVAYQAYNSFRDAITKAPKFMVNLQTGDLFSFPNQFGLHNRLFIEINNPEAAKNRWLLKTYSFRSSDYMNKFMDYFNKSVPGLVIDSLVLSEIE